MTHLLTEREAAQLLGVSVTYLRRLRRAGLVPALRLPAARGTRGAIRYSLRDLDVWIQRRRDGRGWRL
jgi:excisionase family DNA binding protein